VFEEPSYDEDELQADTPVQAPVDETETHEPNPESDESDDAEAGPPEAHEEGIEALFRAVLSDALSDQFSSAAAKLGKQPSQLLRRATSIERDQQNFWYSNVLALASAAGFFPDSDGLIATDVIEKKTTELVQNHLFAEDLGYSLLLRLVVGGPAQSGKTTFFGLLLRQLMLALIGCGRWKRTCLFIFNGDHLAAAASDAQSLYVKIVELTIAAIVAQVPRLTGHATMLRRYFCRIIEVNTLPLLPKRFAQAPETQGFARACADLASCLQAAWNDPESGPAWASLAFRFPIILARELGFEDIIFLIDHFDSMSMTLRCAPQFEPGDIYVSEYMKSALNESHFILSYHDASDFEACMRPLERRFVDFDQGIEYFSTMDLDCVPEYADKVVVVDTESEALTLTAGHFGTVPAYVNQWNKLNAGLEKVQQDSKDAAAEAAEDALSEAITLAGKILPLVFSGDQTFGEVEDVRLRRA
jgi:hypothetical protein